MIKTLYTCMGTGFNPYENLALELSLIHILTAYTARADAIYQSVLERLQ